MSGPLLGFPRQRRSVRELVLSSLVSCSLALLSQFAIALVPRFLPFLSLLAMLPVSGLAILATMALGRCCRRLFGIRASAPAVVIFNLLFLWGVYIAFVRRATPSLLDAFVNAECALLLFGFFKFINAFIMHLLVMWYLSLLYITSTGHSNVFKGKVLQQLQSNVRGFDHHCPAFGNNNHRLFVLLIIGFIIAEASYTMCSTKYLVMSLSTQVSGFKIDVAGNLVVSAMLFAVLQILWQVIFLMWHMYCVCMNIKTDEWINRKKYPEFQLVFQSQQGHPFLEMKFMNPYNKGIIGNMKEFLKSKE